MQFGILGEDAAAERASASLPASRSCDERWCEADALDCRPLADKGLVKERELIMLEQMDEVVNA